VSFRAEIGILTECFSENIGIKHLCFRENGGSIVVRTSEKVGVDMDIERKIYSKLVEWKKERKGTTALLITGARRVGKSYICKRFAQNEYKSSIIIDFGNPTKEITDLIENESYNLDLFFTKLASFYQTILYKRESIIIFDEIQRFPKARQLIKYLVADGRYDYIETGSLLSIKQNVQNIIIPSEEEKIELHPLDFEEFLWALNDRTTMPALRTFYEQMKPIGQALHRKIMNDFRQYMLVGGLPQAVLEYIKEKDFNATDIVKKSILDLYRNDIGKFAGGYASKVLAIYDSIPSQLSKKEKKYVLSSIDKNARFRDYDDAFMWLSDGMIVNPCFNATDPSFGLAMSMDHSTHKLYMADTGLLVTHTFRNNDYLDNELYRAILFDKLGINEGILMENIVAQTFRTNSDRLFFYSRYDKSNRENMIEIDFLLTRGGKVSPVEVKSSVYREHSSLDKFKRKFSKKISESYILYTKDIMIKDNVIHLPIYMAMLI